MHLHRISCVAHGLSIERVWSEALDAARSHFDSTKDPEHPEHFEITTMIYPAAMAPSSLTGLCCLARYVSPKFPWPARHSWLSRRRGWQSSDGEIWVAHHRKHPARGIKAIVYRRCVLTIQPASNALSQEELDASC
jgi:hypothetical protein